MLTYVTYFKYTHKKDKDDLKKFILNVTCTHKFPSHYYKIHIIIIKGMINLLTHQNPQE